MRLCKPRVSMDHRVKLGGDGERVRRCLTTESENARRSRCAFRTPANDAASYLLPWLPAERVNIREPPQALRKDRLGCSSSALRNCGARSSQLRSREAFPLPRTTGWLGSSNK